MFLKAVLHIASFLDLYLMITEDLYLIVLIKIPLFVHAHYRSSVTEHINKEKQSCKK